MVGLENEIVGSRMPFGIEIVFCHNDGIGRRPGAPRRGGSLKVVQVVPQGIDGPLRRRVAGAELEIRKGAGPRAGVGPPLQQGRL